MTGVCSLTWDGILVGPWLTLNLLYKPSWPWTHRHPPASTVSVPHFHSLGLLDCLGSASAQLLRYLHTVKATVLFHPAVHSAASVFIFLLVFIICWSGLGFYSNTVLYILQAGLELFTFMPQSECWNHRLTATGLTLLLYNSGRW